MGYSWLLYVQTNPFTKMMQYSVVQQPLKDRQVSTRMGFPLIFLIFLIFSLDIEKDRTGWVSPDILGTGTFGCRAGHWWESLRDPGGNFWKMEKVGLHGDFIGDFIGIFMVMSLESIIYNCSIYSLHSWDMMGSSRMRSEGFLFSFLGVWGWCTVCS